MLLVTIDDFKTHLYTEIMDEITRADESIIQTALDRGIAQAKGYCSRYAIPAIFGTADEEATVKDPQLAGIIKDLALWHFLQLGNTNIEMSRAQAAYEYAVSWLKDLQKGMVQPEGWPYHDTSTDATPPEGNAVAWSSNTKRSNHF